MKPTTPFYKLKRTDLDLIAKQDGLSRGAIKLFYWLGDRITYGSTCSVDTKDIMVYLEADRSKVSKVVKELEDGLLIRVEHKEGSTRVIQLNPHYYWLGDYSLQPVAIRKWIGYIRQEYWGSVVKDTEVFLNNKSEL